MTQLLLLLTTFFYFTQFYSKLPSSASKRRYVNITECRYQRNENIILGCPESHGSVDFNKLWRSRDDPQTDSEEIYQDHRLCSDSEETQTETVWGPFSCRDEGSESFFYSMNVQNVESIAASVITLITPSGDTEGEVEGRWFAPIPGLKGSLNTWR